MSGTINGPGNEPGSGPGSRGRPRTFDEDAVMERVLMALWRHGYYGISMNDLARAAQVSKPALYNAFGDKAALLKEALRRYGKRTEEIASAIVALRPFADFARAYWQVFIELLCDDNNPPGCLLIGSTVECRNHEELSGFIGTLHAATREKLRLRIEADRERGEIPAYVDSTELAQFIDGQGAALAVMASNHATRQELEQFANTAQRLVRLYLDQDRET